MCWSFDDALSRKIQTRRMDQLKLLVMVFGTQPVQTRRMHVVRVDILYPSDIIRKPRQMEQRMTCLMGFGERPDQTSVLV